jgi:hypothetical protein
MDIHIRANTIYCWHDFGTSNVTRMVNTIEWVMNSQGSCSRDLFLPNSFIDGCDRSNFWYRIAALVSDGVTDWHELEYGAPLNRDDRRQRYVYTWTLEGSPYRFYTKKLNARSIPELVWYVGKGGDCDSDCDTDNEDVML